MVLDDDEDVVVIVTADGRFLIEKLDRAGFVVFIFLPRTSVLLALEVARSFDGVFVDWFVLAFASLLFVGVNGMIAGKLQGMG